MVVLRSSQTVELARVVLPSPDSLLLCIAPVRGLVIQVRNGILRKLLADLGVELEQACRHSHRVPDVEHWVAVVEVLAAYRDIREAVSSRCPPPFGVWSILRRQSFAP